MTVALSGTDLTPGQIEAVAKGRSASLSPEARDRLTETSRWYLAQPGPGILRAKWRWLGAGDPPDDADDMIRHFVNSHCAGIGEPLAPEVVRAVMAARVNVLATGATGCRPLCADALLAMLDADVIPVVPTHGAVGAAGPAALAHILRVTCGFGGEAWREGIRMPAAQAMQGLTLLRPNQKEALALINGATLTVAMAALAVVRARRLLQTAEAACALSFEVVRADRLCLSDRAMRARNHPGAIGVASRLRDRLDGSEIVTDGRRPDPFSIRCAPAVLGAAWDALEHIETVVTRELNGACDNPLVFPDLGVVEAGNFHGAPVAMAMDHLKVAMTQVASISERRTFRMTYGQLSGLPSFLVPNTGLNSGLMLAQYTAASLVSECKGLAHPASVDSLPLIQHTEDHVSMGPVAARGALHILDLLADVLAIELLCGAQGLDFHLEGVEVDEEGERVAVTPRRAGRGSRRAYEHVRERVDRWTDDRPLHPDLAVLGSAVREGVFAD